MGRLRKKYKKPPQFSKTHKLNPTLSDGASQVSTTVIEPFSNLLDKVEGAVSDTYSIKSFKSQSNNQMLKKDKIALRRRMLLKKIDASFVERARILEKKKVCEKVAVASPINDGLTSLQSFIKDQPKIRLFKAKVKKGTEKASIRRKNYLKDVKIFKKIMENKEFKKNPKKMIARRIEAVSKTTKKTT